MKNKIDLYNLALIRKSNKVFIPVSNKNEVTQKQAIAFVADIAQLGCVVDFNVITALMTLSENELKEVHASIVSTLKFILGDHVMYKPLYENFPQGIPENEVFFDSFEKNFIEFLVSIGLTFDIDNHFGIGIKRDKLSEVISYKILSLGTEEDYFKLFSSILASNVPLSVFDKEIVVDTIELIGSNFLTLDLIPEEITIKETMALLAPYVLVYTDRLDKYLQIKTATDVLRIATALSEGDISLKSNTEFKSFSNRERRILLSLLEGVENPEEDMVRHAKKWIFLGEKIHPGSYAKKFPKAFSAFQKIRNNLKSINTFNKSVKNAMKSKNLEELVLLLKARPSEFLRNLHTLLRIAVEQKNTELVLSILNEVAVNVKPAILLQVKRLIEMSDSYEEDSVRYFVPKGNVAKIAVVKNELKPLPVDLILSVSDILKQAILGNFKNKNSFSSVYIDERLKSYLVPTSMRATNKAINVVARGSQIDFEMKDTIRFFAYWKENGSRVDLDLSAVAFNENWEYISHLSYTNSRSIGESVHSGDIRSAPNGASEFIDIDVESFKKVGKVRYVVMNVFSFTGQSFSSFTAHAGFMKRSKPKSGEIYEPTTVINKFDIYGEGQASIPLILDLYENKVIWADIDLGMNNVVNNIEFNKSNIVLMGRALSDFVNTKPNLFNLFELNALAVGANIDYDFDSSKEYDYIFSIDKINEKTILPSMLNEITDKWL